MNFSNLLFGHKICVKTRTKTKITTKTMTKTMTKTTTKTMTKTKTRTDLLGVGAVVGEAPGFFHLLLAHPKKTILTQNQVLL